MKYETHENIHSEVGKDNLYEIYKMILDEKELRSVRLKANSNIYIILKDRMV